MRMPINTEQVKRSSAFRALCVIVGYFTLTLILWTFVSPDYALHLSEYSLGRIIVMLLFPLWIKLHPHGFGIYLMVTSACLPLFVVAAYRSDYVGLIAGVIGSAVWVWFGPGIGGP